MAEPRDGPALIELVRSNPIEMEGTYSVDRSPDFFALHRCFPGSVVYLGERPDLAQPTGCSSLFRYRGRLGDEVAPFLHCANMCRHPDTSARALHAVVLAMIRAYRASDARALSIMVNEGNELIRRMADSPRVRLPLRRLGTLDYVEIMPLARHRIPGRYRFRRASTSADLERGLAILNTHYARHSLWEPLTVAEYERRCLLLPGFTPGNLVLQEQGGVVVGALIYYDPAPLVNLRIERYDRWAGLAAGAMRRLGRLTAQQNAPPAEGEIIRTLHLQAVAWTGRAGRHLLGWLGNEALRHGAHTFAYLVDERHPLPVPHRLRFAYKALFYATFKSDAPVTPEAFSCAPLYFNITLD